MRIFLVVSAPPRQCAINRLARLAKSEEKPNLLEFIPDQSGRKVGMGRPISSKCFFIKKKKEKKNFSKPSYG